MELRRKARISQLPNLPRCCRSFRAAKGKWELKWNSSFPWLPGSRKPWATRLDLVAAVRFESLGDNPESSPRQASIRGLAQKDLKIGVAGLEVRAEFAERRKNDQLSGAGHHRLVFELPGVLVRNIHRVEANLHGRVDVAARAVADHPAVRLHDLVFAHQFPVSVRAFLGNDFDELEETL